MPTRRFRLIFGRWISLFWCGVIAGTVVAVLDPFLRQLLAPGGERLSRLHPMVMAMMMLVLAGAVCWSFGRRRWRGFIGLRFFFTYPPLWVAMVFAAGAFAVARVLNDGPGSVNLLARDVAWLSTQVPIVIWLLLLLLIVAVVVVHLWPRMEALVPGPWSFRRTNSNNDDQAADEFDDLRAWLCDDEEVESPAADRFGHDDIARRMALRLIQNEEAPTMAVIGLLGSGKSTIRGLVAFHLQETPKVRLIHVSLWPFDSTEAAVRGILQAIVDELGRHVNVLPLAGLSDDYIMAIEKAAGIYGGIARLLRGASSPEKIVQRFSDIACAAGLRLVLWIEDLERFSGGDRLEGAALAEREVERLGPIRALLYLLDRCPQVSVVVADTSLRTRFDIGKIARFVEQPPSMDMNQVWRVTSLLRSRCLDGYPKSMIDPTRPEERQAFVASREWPGIHRWISSFRGSDPTVPEAVTCVLDTPRTLKSALRMTLEVWEALAGEIDFDSVLIASALRAARPDVFTLVSEHIDLFRNGLTDPFSPGDGEKKPHAVVERIDELLRREDERTAAALRKLLHFLFPKYPPDQGRGDDGHVSRPQSLFVDRHADYWRRYLTQAPVADFESDQKALASILAWREGKTTELVDQVVDPSQGSQIADFVGQFLPSELCRLLREVSDRLLAQSAAEWEHRAHAPGITTVWGMMHIKQPPSDLVYRTVLEIVDRATPVHLPLAYDVTHYFARGSNPRVRRFMSDPQQQEVVQRLRGALLTHFTGDGAERRLACALRDGSPWLIRWIVCADQELALPAIPFDRWPEFSKVLLDLAESQPGVGVPLIVPFVTRSEMSWSRGRLDDEPETERGWLGQFDAEAAKRLFDHDRLMRVLAGFVVAEELDEQMRASCRAAVDAARAASRGL